MIAVYGACLLGATYAAWVFLPDSWSLAKTILRDAGMFGWPVVGGISIFATPAGYSDEERRATPPSKLWWTYFLLLPSIPMGLMSFLWILYWI